MTDSTSTLRSRQRQILFGLSIVLIAVVLLSSMVSYYFTWEHDQSSLGDFADRSVQTENIASKFGTIIAHFLLYQFLGLGSFVLVLMVLITGFRLFIGSPWNNPLGMWSWTIASSIWASLLLSFIAPKYPILGGMVGYEMSRFTTDYIGDIGLAGVLIFGCVAFMVVILKITPEKILTAFSSLQTEKDNTESIEEEKPAEPVDLPAKEAVKPSPKPTKSTVTKAENPDEVKLTIDKPIADEPEVELAKKLVKEQGEVDPTLELSKFREPTLELLKLYNEEGITINEAELEENKEKIVETLSNYKIGIADIKATIGPTVTLYEIIPSAGIRISKIKNLEDDIALSLSALGIRIIAPIPGKGTIGIEVPNKNPTIVSFRSVVGSKNFQEAEMELPLALGKTISNETFVVDLAKMPHMLMAGATGQGKSVGLNTILSSLLYKKHPAEIKFVLVDPKKVELTLYNKIERHYLAKLPDVEDAIITDNRQVINTLNSLCIEMDNRYNMLKNAMCRNIKEYNKRFKKRELNPNDGHAFLPYLVLIVDEFADLIMTAGKEVEAPIARLAQLARAVGIHLIIATQRPSVNVITGVIKANFPARVAFRVTSRIDSRTILDSGGAEQLIGRGDMLFTQGNELIRLQCAFVDTPEVEKLTDYIGSQRAYPSAHQLPEYQGDEQKSGLDNNIKDRDPMFREAAEVVVNAQQGSASLLQRKLKLGYNRAGRIVDQLEAAGIVGPFEGSKAREVMFRDIIALHEFLENEQ
ncbi:MAG: DNA translocase FtsK 4TM domain-containing protein [Flavobacteriaceae bacterium]|nr:DNA translocase FtsK 4TM domain-containing protein [Flavobacteriaceae bacterium]